MAMNLSENNMIRRMRLKNVTTANSKPLHPFCRDIRMRQFSYKQSWGVRASVALYIAFMIVLVYLGCATLKTGGRASDFAGLTGFIVLVQLTFVPLLLHGIN